MAARRLRAVLDVVIAVVRADDAPGPMRLQRLLEAEGCTVLRCEGGEGNPGGGSGQAARGRAEGMGTSIASGVRATAHAQGWIIALADMPNVRVETVHALRQALCQGAASAAPYYRGRRGHPVAFGAACGPALAALTGDRGGRAILEHHRPVRIDVDDPGILFDVDVPADLTGAHATEDGRGADFT